MNPHPQVYVSTSDHASAAHPILCNCTHLQLCLARHFRHSLFFSVCVRGAGAAPRSLVGVVVDVHLGGCVPAEVCVSLPCVGSATYALSVTKSDHFHNMKTWGKMPAHLLRRISVLRCRCVTVQGTRLIYRIVAILLNSLRHVTLIKSTYISLMPRCEPLGVVGSRASAG